MPREPGWWYRPPGAFAAGLAPLALVYGRIAARRLERATPYRSRLPVICAGNFTAGGSGKTPFIAMLAERLVARGERPAILTRGFGGRERGPRWVDPGADTAALVGDEPLLLARVAPVIVARDRCAGARTIEARGAEATVILMDDGLQNPSLSKDLVFAVVDGARGLGNGRVIPAGPLRAPLAAQLAATHAIVFNGTAQTGLAATLTDGRAVPRIDVRLEPRGDVSWLQGTRVVAFAGIGNPPRFFETLRTHGALLAETVAFPDHARFSDADADRLLASAARHGARLVTTEKDQMRLSGSPRLDALAAACGVLAIRMAVENAGSRTLDDLLDRALARHR